MAAVDDDTVAANITALSPTQPNPTTHGTNCAGPMVIAATYDAHDVTGADTVLPVAATTGTTAHNKYRTSHASSRAATGTTARAAAGTNVPSILDSNDPQPVDDQTELGGRNCHQRYRCVRQRKTYDHCCR